MLLFIKDTTATLAPILVLNTVIKMQKNEFCLNFYTAVLNTNLNNRAGLILCGSAPANDANLLFVENRITFFETIVSTLNTPYKANLTQGLTAGIAITYMSAPGFGIQLHLSTGAPDNNTGAPKAFMRAYSNYIMGAWH